MTSSMRWSLIFASLGGSYAAGSGCDSSGRRLASSSSGSGSACEVCFEDHSWTHYCRYESLNALKDLVKEELKDLGCSDEDLHDAIAKKCNEVCPVTDRKYQCLDHTYHSLYSEWLGEMVAQTTLQWNIFFVAFCLLLGALFKQCLPAQIPYTVGILLAYFLFGIIAQKVT